MEREFETIVDGSVEARVLCHNYLEPAADILIGEKLRDSDLTRIDTERKEVHEDGYEIEISFEATKTVEEDGNANISYNVCATVTRPFSNYFYWPGLSPNIAGNEVKFTEREFITSTSTFDDLESGLLDTEDWRVQEVWDFYINDTDYQPRKDIRWEYYDEEGELLGLVNANNPGISQQTLLSEPLEDADLKERETALSHSFSAQDLNEILGILERFGFKFPENDPTE